jgi:hypothetical protein
MAYDAPTPAILKADFPAFTGVDDAVVQKAIDRAGRQVGTTWTEEDFTYAIELYACALMTVQGLGIISQGDAAVIGGLKTMVSGALRLEFKDAAQTTDPTADPVFLTSYGRQFAALRRQNVGGPRVTATGFVPGYGNGGLPWGC